MSKPREVRERQDLIRWIVRVLVALLMVWAGGLLAFVAKLPRAVDNPSQTADGIAVLTGGSARLSAGLQLLADDMGRRLLISGVNEQIDREVLRRAVGGPAAFDCCVDLGREARDTVGNAQEIAGWAAAHDYETLRIVTASYHMPRSLLEISRAADGLELISHPVFPDSVKLDGWWGWPGTTTLVVSEYDKYLFSLIAVRLDDLFGWDKIGSRVQS
jgi:uncharacterized SAM-binding protein YcdF (DUF218 family)